MPIDPRPGELHHPNDAIKFGLQFLVGSEIEPSKSGLIDDLDQVFGDAVAGSIFPFVVQIERHHTPTASIFHFPL